MSNRQAHDYYNSSVPPSLYTTAAVFSDAPAEVEQSTEEFVVVPTVADMSPLTGTIEGGTVVTIEGMGLTGSSGVTFGGVAGTAFDDVSDTSVSVTTPAGEGTVDVELTDSEGEKHLVADKFTYV